MLNQPEVMIASAADKFDKQGKLTNEKSKELIGKLLQGLVDWTLKLRAK